MRVDLKIGEENPKRIKVSEMRGEGEGVYKAVTKPEQELFDDDGFYIVVMSNDENDDWTYLYLDENGYLEPMDRSYAQEYDYIKTDFKIQIRLS